jgi:hypothetical protein
MDYEPFRLSEKQRPQNGFDVPHDFNVSQHPESVYVSAIDNLMRWNNDSQSQTLVSLLGLVT